jgi:PhnB protein
MSGSNDHIRHGFGAVRPYVYGYPEMADLIHHAFGALELERHDMGGENAHLEARIGDSVIVLELGNPPHADGTPGSIYVYVPNADEAYARALENGCSAVSEPEDKHYSERSAGVRDRYGNVWWISQYTGESSD